MTICTGITKVKDVGSGELLLVDLESDGLPQQAYWFFNYADALPYLNKEVIVDFRTEIIDGQPRQVINTFVLPTEVKTLDAYTNIKLYTKVTDNYADVSFRDLQVNEQIPNACLFCIKQERKASEKATWWNYTVRDKNMNVTTLRLFSPEYSMGDCSGHYIVVSPLIKTPYGLQTESVVQANGEALENPEVTIAETFIKEYCKSSPTLTNILLNKNLLQAMKSEVYYESGYLLVKLAMELSLASQLTNLTDAVDKRVVEEILVSSYLHLLQTNSVLSPEARCIILSLKMNYTNKEIVVRSLDQAATNQPAEAAIAQNIQNLASSLIKAKKDTTI